jgi:light-independent protochlorophyllide reductase subunit N
VRVLNYSGSGIETTFTQGEDACLASLVPDCRPPTEPALLVVGALADVVEDQFRACSTQTGHRPGAVLPAAPRRTSCRRSARTPASCWRSPSWPTPRARSKPAARSAWRHPSRSAWKARRPGCRPPPRLWHQPDARCQQVTARAPTRRTRAGPPPHRWPGKRIFFFPDSQLELPLARFLSRELGMQLAEVGTPYLHRSTWRRNWRCCPPAPRSAKARTSTASSTAAAPPAPDIVVCGLGLANPLEAEGMTTKWSIELVFTPIQGFDQAGDLAELFARPLRRVAWRLVA